MFLNYNEDEIISIEYIGEEDTIDINVTDDHLFVANGILTHNCAVDEVEFNHSHISGGLSKIQTADAVYGIFTSRALRERGQYQVQLMKTRNSSGVGQTFNLGFNVDTLRISDCEDDELGDGSNGYSSQSATTGSNLIASIKQRATVTAEAEPVPTGGKVKAEVASSKLRQLLNNLPSDD